MNNPEKTEEKLSKKSERLDVRISHDRKVAFSKACEEQGDTPSHAIRRFVTSYIRRSNRDNVRSVARHIGWRKPVFLTLAMLAFGVGVYQAYHYVSANHEEKITSEVFAIYDADKNGRLDLGEITADDYHLHRVLNIDGEGGISRDEFYAKGRMIWKFVDPETFRIVKYKDGHSRQEVVMRTTHTFIDDGTTDPDAPEQKRYIYVDGELVELTDETLEASIKKAVKEGSSENFKAMRAHREVPESSRRPPDKFNTHLVEFDLRTPDNFTLTVYEQKQHGMRGVLTNYNRSVIWVEGRKTPELVMGLDHEKAVLTTAVKVEREG